LRVMKQEDIFGKTIACECGQTHHIEPQTVIYADDAAARLSAFCLRKAQGRRAAVLMDVRTRQAAGEALVQAFRSDGWAVVEILADDRDEAHPPVCDEVTKSALAERVERPDLIVSVGAGVLSDLGKWIAFEAGVPFAAFATAASMNGYASANVAPVIGGIKTLVRARPPRAVAASPTVLQDAPYELTVAGLGDVLAKSTSTADWYLNHKLFGDYYCRRSVSLIVEVEPLYLERPEAIRRREPEAMEALFRALLLTGAAMTMAETSSPASGGEHLISHALDMLSWLDGHPHDLHGRQVGLATVLTAELYRRVLEVDEVRPIDPLPRVDRKFWGPLADAVEGQYAAKLPRLWRAKEILARRETWRQIRGELQPMLRPAGTIRNCLRRARAAWRAKDIGCEMDRLQLALNHAHEIRNRFTVLDLARLMGILPACSEEILRSFD